ncbi:MAG: hypothetical protein LQ352_004989 [Teloschistes flavicans]|nr:MAG: hypothetical protein LQ352_004989 [Teloschistes flavicans]
MDGSPQLLDPPIHPVLFARSDLSFLRTYTANTTKHRNAKPPTTPPTIAPVLLVEDPGLFDAWALDDELPAELGEDVEDGEDIDALDPEDGAAEVWIRDAVGEAQR